MGSFFPGALCLFPPIGWECVRWDEIVEEGETQFDSYYKIENNFSKKY